MPPAAGPMCRDACGRCGKLRRCIRRNHPKDVIASACATKALLQNGCGPKAKIRSRPGLPLPAPVPKSPDRGFGSTRSVREPMQTTTKTTITKTMSLPIAKRPPGEANPIPENWPYKLYTVHPPQKFNDRPLLQRHPLNIGDLCILIPITVIRQPPAA